MRKRLEFLKPDGSKTELKAGCVVCLAPESRGGSFCFVDADGADTQFALRGNTGPFGVTGSWLWGVGGASDSSIQPDEPHHKRDLEFLLLIAAAAGCSLEPVEPGEVPRYLGILRLEGEPVDLYRLCAD